MEDRYLFWQLDFALYVKQDGFLTMVSQIPRGSTYSTILELVPPKPFLGWSVGA